MKFFSKSFNDLRGELGIKRVHLARLPRREVNDQEGDHRDEDEGNDFLYDTTSDKG